MWATGTYLLASLTETKGRGGSKLVSKLRLQIQSEGFVLRRTSNSDHVGSAHLATGEPGSLTRVGVGAIKPRDEKLNHERPEEPKGL